MLPAGWTYLSKRSSKGAFYSEVRVDCDGAKLRHLMSTTMPGSDTERLHRTVGFIPFLDGVVRKLCAPAFAVSASRFLGL